MGAGCFKDNKTGCGLVVVGAAGKAGDCTEYADGVGVGGLVGSKDVVGGCVDGKLVGDDGVVGDLLQFPVDAVGEFAVGDGFSRGERAGRASSLLF